MTPTDDLSPESRKQLASEFSGKLAEALKPESISSVVSLRKVELELSELGELLEQAIEDGAEEEAVAISQQISKYLSAEVAKVDSYHGFIKIGVNLIAELKSEEERLYRCCKAWETAIERVKGCAVFVMQAMGKKRLEGSHGRRLRLHPSPVSVEVTNPAIVPDEFLRITATMGLPTYKHLHEPLDSTLETMSIGETKDYQRACKDISRLLHEHRMDLRMLGMPEVSLSRIKAFIEAGQTCPECEGGGKSSTLLSGVPAGEPCPRCNGAGRIPGHVPGCKLTQGVHLRVE